MELPEPDFEDGEIPPIYNEFLLYNGNIFIPLGSEDSLGFLTQPESSDNESTYYSPSEPEEDSDSEWYPETESESESETDDD